MVAPGRDGIRLVEPGAERNGFPEALDVGLAEDLSRPAARRIRNARPVDGAVDHLLADDLVDLFHSRTSDPFSVELGKQLRFRIARGRDQCVTGPGPRERLLPFRRVVQRLVGAELDHRLANVRIPVLDVDVRGACLISGPRDRARQRGVLDVGGEHEDRLSLLDVRADADGQLRVAGKPFLGV